MINLVTDDNGRWLALIPLLLGQALASLATSIVSVAAPSIQAGLHTGGWTAQLILSAYVLAYAVTLVLGARLGVDHGPRRLFLLGTAVFLTGALVSAVAPDVWVLLAAQLGEGVAAALFVPQILSLIQLRFLGPERARAIGLYSMVMAVGVALGQLLGGVLVTTDPYHLGWRSVFVVGAIIAGLILVLTVRLVPPSPGAGTQALDLRGILLLALGVGLLVVPLTFGPSLEWPLWTWAALLLSPALLALFVAAEGRLQRTGGLPALDLRVLRSPAVIPGLLIVASTMGGYGGFFFAVSQYLQVHVHATSLEAGLAFLPYALGFALASLGWRRLPTSAERWGPLCGLTALVVGDGLLVALLGGGWTAAALPCLVVAGSGHGLAFSTAVARISRHATPERAAAISALVMTSMQLAFALGIALIGGVYVVSEGLRDVCLTVAVLSLVSTGAAWRLAHSSRQPIPAGEALKEAPTGDRC